MKNLIAVLIAVVAFAGFSTAQARDYTGRVNGDNLAFGITSDYNVPFAGATALGVEYATIDDTNSVTVVAQRRFATPLARVSTNVGVGAGYGWGHGENGLAYSYAAGAEYQLTRAISVGVESRTYRTNFAVRDGRDMNETTNAFTVRLRR